MDHQRCDYCGAYIFSGVRAVVGGSNRLLCSDRCRDFAVEDATGAALDNAVRGLAGDV